MSERHNGIVVAWSTNLAVSLEVRKRLHAQSVEALRLARASRSTPPPSGRAASIAPSKP